MSEGVEIDNGPGVVLVRNPRRVQILPVRIL